MADKAIGDVARHPRHSLPHGRRVDRDRVARRRMRPHPALDVDVVVVALVADRLAAIGLLHDQPHGLDRLLQMRGRPAVFHAVPGLVEALDARPEAEAKAAAGELVDVQRRDGEDEGAARERPCDAGPDGDPVGDGTDVGRLGDRAAEQLGRPDAVDARLLGRLGLGGELVCGAADGGDGDALQRLGQLAHSVRPSSRACFSTSAKGSELSSVRMLGSCSASSRTDCASSRNVCSSSAPSSGSPSARMPSIWPWMLGMITSAANFAWSALLGFPVAPAKNFCPAASSFASSALQTASASAAKSAGRSPWAPCSPLAPEAPLAPLAPLVVVVVVVSSSSPQPAASRPADTTSTAVVIFSFMVFLSKKVAPARRGSLALSGAQTAQAGTPRRAAC